MDFGGFSVKTYLKIISWLLLFYAFKNILIIPVLKRFIMLEIDWVWKFFNFLFYFIILKMCQFIATKRICTSSYCRMRDIVDPSLCGFSVLNVVCISSVNKYFLLLFLLIYIKVCITDLSFIKFGLSGVLLPSFIFNNKKNLRIMLLFFCRFFIDFNLMF